MGLFTETASPDAPAQSAEIRPQPEAVGPQTDNAAAAANQSASGGTWNGDVCASNSFQEEAQQGRAISNDGDLAASSTSGQASASDGARDHYAKTEEQPTGRLSPSAVQKATGSPQLASSSSSSAPDVDPVPSPSLSAATRTAAPPQRTRPSVGSNNIRIRVYLGHTVEPAALKAAVAELGGYEAVVRGRQWQLVRRKLNLPEGTSSGFFLRKTYEQYTNRETTHSASPAGRKMHPNSRRRAKSASPARTAHAPAPTVQGHQAATLGNIPLAALPPLSRRSVAIPEAPTFTPTWEQFKDPLKYIASIAEDGAQYGICRIRPPMGWRPPFAVNVDDDKYAIRTRVQRMADIELCTRQTRHFELALRRFLFEQNSVSLQTIKSELAQVVGQHFLVDTRFVYRTFLAVGRAGGFKALKQPRDWEGVVSVLLGRTFAQQAEVSNKLRKWYSTSPLVAFEQRRRFELSQSAQENASAIAAEQQVREDALRRQLKARGASKADGANHAKEVLKLDHSAPVEATVDVADDADEIAVPSLLSKATTDRVLSNRFPPTDAGLAAVSQLPNAKSPSTAAGSAASATSTDDAACEAKSKPAQTRLGTAADKSSSGRRRSSRGAARKAREKIKQWGDEEAAGIVEASAKRRAASRRRRSVSVAPAAIISDDVERRFPSRAYGPGANSHDSVVTGVFVESEDPVVNRTFYQTAPDGSVALGVVRRRIVEASGRAAQARMVSRMTALQASEPDLSTTWEVFFPETRKHELKSDLDLRILLVSGMSAEDAQVLHMDGFCQVCLGNDLHRHGHECSGLTFTCMQCESKFHGECLLPSSQRLPNPNLTPTAKAKTARAADWFCSKCLSQPIPQFGFSDSATMLVREFRAQANEFEQQIRNEIARRKNAGQRQFKKARRPGQRKRKHPIAGVKPEDISAEELESYYWEVLDPERIEAVNRMSYSILYGSDLDCRIVGSGFPQGDRHRTSPKGQSDIGFNEKPAGAPPTSINHHTDFRAGVHGPKFSRDSHLKRSCTADAVTGTRRHSSDVDVYQKEVWQMYANDGWNLNNMPLLSESVLQMLPGRIAGISRPWLYFGMCFASFCWHVEDHWLYSINFMHAGRGKIWYGVPRRHAPKFDKVAKELAPELFRMKPGLLDSIISQINPSTLRMHGVDVYKVVQEPGDFIVTFPRGYHSGFSLGFNCGEAVNFATADWLRLAPDASDAYAARGRNPVLSYKMLLLAAMSRLQNEGIDCLDPLTRREVVKGFAKLIRRHRFELETWRKAGVPLAAEIDAGLATNVSAANVKLPAGHKLVVTPHSAPMSTLPSKRNVTHAPKTQPVKCAGKPKFDASGRRVWRRLARRCSHCGCARCPASHPAGTCSATDGERMRWIIANGNRVITAPSKSTLTTCSRCGAACWRRNKDLAAAAAVKFENGSPAAGSTQSLAPGNSVSNSQQASNVRGTETPSVCKASAIAPLEVPARPISAPALRAITSVEPEEAIFAQSANTPTVPRAVVPVTLSTTAPARPAAGRVSQSARHSASRNALPRSPLKFPLHGSEELFFQMLYEQRPKLLSKVHTVGRVPINMWNLYCAVQKRNGHVQVVQHKLWREVADELGVPKTATASSYQLNKLYIDKLLQLETGAATGAPSSSSRSSSTASSSASSPRSVPCKRARAPKVASPPTPEPARTWKSWAIASLPDFDKAGVNYPDGAVAPAPAAAAPAAASSTSAHTDKTREGDASSRGVVVNTKGSATVERNRSVRLLFSQIVHMCTAVGSGMPFDSTALAFYCDLNI
eukprot:INCI7053.1.p1 GENE.INCI7053.1~~INCI7053.1.p1  ORF type:complete len:1777 (+),score=250.18 INCI7053.1:445-5775(+)